jgi:hypothetical protein
VVEQQQKNAPTNKVDLSFFFELSCGIRLGCDTKSLGKRETSVDKCKEVKAQYLFSVNGLVEWN